MNTGFGLFRKLRFLWVLGAVALVVGLGALAALRAQPAHATLDSCTTAGLSDFLNDFPTTGKIGFQQQIQCSNSNASITGTACIWAYIPLYDDWYKQGGTCDSRVSLKLQTLYKMTPCYTDNLATWKYQARASWVVHFPDGNYYGYNQWTTIRPIGCQVQGGVVGPGGGH